MGWKGGVCEQSRLFPFSGLIAGHTMRVGWNGRLTADIWVAFWSDFPRVH